MLRPTLIRLKIKHYEFKFSNSGMLKLGVDMGAGVYV